MRLDGTIEVEVARNVFHGFTVIVLVFVMVYFRLFPRSKGGFGGPWTIFRKSFLADRGVDLSSRDRIAIVGSLVALGIIRVMLDAIF